MGSAYPAKDKIDMIHYIINVYFMRINKFFLLKIWILSTLLIAFICACIPDIRTLPFQVGRQSLAYREGMFVGVLEMALTFSVPIFLCLYGLYYLLTVRFFLPGLIVKSALVFLFLTGVFICNYIYFPWTWFHPFFIAYITGTASIIFIFHIYKFDLNYID
jgi:hypothetical protein